MSTDQIVSGAMALPAEERAKLAEQLLASLAGPEQRAIDDAWAQEIEARIDAFEQGRESARPASAVMREIRERLSRP